MVKNVLILSASPRKGGNSDLLCDQFAKGAEESGHQVEKIRVQEKKIAPCLACYGCRNTGVCVQKDDMAQVLEKARKADGIAFFSPIYWWQVTAQEKIVIDRLYPMTAEDWKGKKLTVVVNGAAEDDDREFDLLKAQFQEMADYIGAELHFLGVGTTDDEVFSKAMNKLKDFISESN